MCWKPQVDGNNRIKWNKERILLTRKLRKEFDAKDGWRLENNENKRLTSKTVETLWNELESSKNTVTMTFILDSADSSQSKSGSLLWLVNVVLAC